MSVFSELLGTSLQGQKGETLTTTEALAGARAVALYFSAHWCPPCRGFTPKLAEWYTKSLKEKGLEVVFVSSDRDEKAFKEYFGEMPWLALPFGDRDRKASLSKKFKVSGIPSLVILDGETGATITTDGRAAVSKDPTGADFPWTPKPFKELLGESFLRTASGETVGKEALEGKVLGVYFSAHWCPPCRGFTPKLAECYKKLQAKGLPFEIVFASSDRDEKAFTEYFGEMPWLALPFGDKRKEQWSSQFEVSGIPTFVILDKDEERTLINEDGRAAVMADPEGAEFPWQPKPVGDMANPSGIEETPSVLLFMEEESPEAQEKLHTALNAVAVGYREEAEKTKEDPKYLFFAAKNGGARAVQSIRKGTRQGRAAGGDSPTKKGCTSWMLGPFRRSSRGGRTSAARTSSCATATTAKPTLVLLNLDDQGAYYEPVDGSDVSEASIRKLIADFEQGKLKRKQWARE